MAAAAAGMFAGDLDAEVGVVHAIALDRDARAAVDVNAVNQMLGLQSHQGRQRRFVASRPDCDEHQPVSIAASCWTR